MATAATATRMKKAITKFIRPAFPELKVFAFSKTDKVEIAKALALIAKRTIAEADAEGAANTLRYIKDLRRAAESHFDVIKKPVNVWRGMVLDQEKADVQPLVKAEETLADMVKMYLREQKRIADVEAARIAAEAVARAQADRQTQVSTLESAAAGAPDAVTKQAIQQEAKSLESAPLVVEQMAAPEPKKLAGISTRPVYGAECFDLDALIRAYVNAKPGDKNPGPSLELFAINQTALNTWANSTQGNAVLPGVIVKRDEALSGRRL